MDKKIRNFITKHCSLLFLVVEFNTQVRIVQRNMKWLFLSYKNIITSLEFKRGIFWMNLLNKYIKKINLYCNKSNKNIISTRNLLKNM